MTSMSNSAASLSELAPNVTHRVKDGDLATAQFGLLGVGAALIGLGLALGGDDRWASYLVGYMGALGICLCALFFTMLQHITRAGWSVTVRRVSENMMAVLPFMLLLFAPVLFGFEHLYHHWLDPKADDLVLSGKAGYLNKGFFFARVAIYFTIWIGLATFFRRGSIKQDQTGDPALSLRMSRVAAPGLLLFALSITFAAFDWIMSLDPHWFSTIFGINYFAGGFMAFLAFTILLCRWLGAKGYLKEAITTEHYHDLGKLMFSFMVFWTYTNFSQYMLIWYANLPEETHWFAVRAKDGWGALGTMLVFGHFFIPFVFLMSRHVKRNSVALSVGAIFLLIIHCMDMQYLIVPSVAHVAEGAGHGGEVAHGAQEAGHSLSTSMWNFSEQLPQYLHNLHWTDFACFAGMLSLVGGLTLLNLRKTNLVPLRDPRLAEALHFQNQ